MKKNISFAIVFLACALSFSTVVYAAPATPTITPKPTNSSNTPTDAADQARIEQIKNLVASRVAELKLVDKVGFLGTVQDVRNTELTIQDDTDNTISIDIDELTKFDDSANDKFGISDVKKNDTIAAIGLYNKETKRLLARNITKMHTLPVFFEGIITDKDTKNYTYTARDESGKEKILNIENSSKIQTYSNGDDGAAKSGFSKIGTGLRVFAAGFTDLKDPKTINISRLIAFTDLPPSDAMKSHAGNVLQSTGSVSPTSTVTPTTTK